MGSMIRVAASLLACTVALTLADSARATTGTALFSPALGPANVCYFANTQSSGYGQLMTAPIPSANSFALGGSGGGKLHPLSSYPVYLIFVGQDWTTDHTSTGPLTSIASGIVSDVQALTSSTYFSGVIQYGSAGKVTFPQSNPSTNYWVDACTDPLNNSWTAPSPSLAWYEVNRAITSHADCPNPNQSAWAGAAGTSDASNSAIYVEIHYWCADHGTSVCAPAYAACCPTCAQASCPGGSNMFNGPDSVGDIQCESGSTGCMGNCQNSYITTPVNLIDVSVPYPDVTADPGYVSWTISHEIAERLSSGTGTNWCGECGAPQGPLHQIADAEPEDWNDSLTLSGSVAPSATAYWSVVDQAYIEPGVSVPDSWPNDIDARILFSGTTPSVNQQISFRKGSLTAFQLYDGLAPQSGNIDTQVLGYTVDVSGNLYDVTTSGQVKQFTGNLFQPSWTTITASTINASAITAARAPDPCTYGFVGGGLYMAGENNGSVPLVWQYSGSGTTWNALTTTSTNLKRLVAVTNSSCPSGTPVTSTNVYMLASQGTGGTYVWQWTGGQNWSPITGSNTAVTSIVTANENLYMLASNTGTSYQAWQYVGPGTNWQQIVPSNWLVDQIWVAGDVLMMAAIPGGSGPWQVFEYVPPSGGTPGNASNWTQLTTNATLEGNLSVVQDGIENFILANYGSGDQVFEFEGIASQSNSSNGWLAISSTSSYNPQALRIGTGDVLQMEVLVGRFYEWLTYQGVPNSW